MLDSFDMFVFPFVRLERKDVNKEGERDSDKGVQELKNIKTESDIAGLRRG